MTHLFILLTFVSLFDETFTLGQDNTCYQCEEYLGNYCQCERYDIYWNVDKRLYGISKCTGLNQVTQFFTDISEEQNWNDILISIHFLWSLMKFGIKDALSMTTCICSHSSKFVHGYQIKTEPD